MTEEEAKKKQEQQQAQQAATAASAQQEPDVSVSGRSTTTQNQRGTTHQQSEQSGESESTQSGESRSTSYTTITPENEQRVDAAAQRAASAYGYDYNPQTGEMKQGTVFDALNIDRAKIRDAREKQQKLNRWKQIESALFNSGAILSDMISAGVGGNVWRREKDTTAQDAAKDMERLRELQAAEDAAAAMQERQDRVNAFNAAQTARNQEYERLKQTVSGTKQSGESKTKHSGKSTTDGTTTGNTTSTTDQTQGTAYSDQYWASKNKGGYTIDDEGNIVFGAGSGGRGGSGNGTASLQVRIRGKNGEEVKEIKIAKSDKEELVNTAHSLLQEAMNRGEISVDDLKGIYTPANTLKGKDASWDDKVILSSKVVLNQPRILNKFIDKLVGSGYTIDGNKITRAQAYEMITGVSPYGNDGKIAANKVLRGVILDNVGGTSATIDVNTGFNPDAGGTTNNNQQPAGGL